MTHRRNRKRKDRKNLGQSASDISVKILQALNDQNYIARTVAGIAKEAHASPVLIVKTIKSDPKLQTIVKVFPRRAKTGEILLTTREKFNKKASFKDKFIDFFSTNHASIDDAH